jgi:hypothetical protein
MANGIAALGKARRNIIKRKKATNVVSGALGTGATIAAFGASQAKKASTAWDEYETGYKEMGGDPANIEKPGFFKRTAQQILPGGKTGLPEGEVRIGDKMYGRKDIRKAGSFLGSDAASMLSDEQRSKYLRRTAPGRLAPGLGTAPSTQPHIYSAEELVNLSGYDNSPVVDREIRKSKRSLDFTPKKIQEGPQIPEMNRPLHAMSSEEVGIKKEQENLWDIQSSKEQENLWDIQSSNVNKFKNQSLKGYDAMNQYRMNAYAKGGDFITNGPQKILVGDNPGGRERVIVEPLPPKEGKSDHDEAKYGRYGDDAMKVIDGELAHINSKLEKYMSPEDIKNLAMGGTINPITGKKEYFLGALATAFSIGSSLYKGYQATQNKDDIDTAKAAAGQMYQDQLGLLTEKRGVAVSGANLGMEVAESQFQSGQENIGMATNMQLRNIQAFGDKAYSQSGLATSGTIDQQVDTQGGNVMAQYQSDMKKLVDTRAFAGKERDLSINEADLAYRSGQMSAEEAFQNRLTELESVPTTVMEGLFS